MTRQRHGAAVSHKIQVQIERSLKNGRTIQELAFLELKDRLNSGFVPFQKTGSI